MKRHPISSRIATDLNDLMVNGRERRARSLKRNPERDKIPLRIVRDQTYNEATVYLYDEIGYWGVTAGDFAQQLDALDVETIHLRLNSPGGDVFDGVAMYNALLQHKAQVVTHVDGLAASIASVIALAGDEIEIAETAFFMIHNAWTLAIGNANDLRTTAGLLDKIDGMITATYVKQADADEGQIEQWMAQETWFTADEALEAGFASRIAGQDDEEETASASARVSAFDLSVFAHTPAALTSLTSIAALAAKSQPTNQPTIRNIERSLREAGLSRSEARAFAALGSKALSTQRDAGDEQLIEQSVTAGLKGLLATIRS
jgi:ATP-dependent Clp protease protease subunit